MQSDKRCRANDNNVIKRFGFCRSEAPILGYALFDAQSFDSGRSLFIIWRTGMNTYQTLAAIALTLATAIPGLVSANSAWHFVDNEQGAVLYPAHLESTRSRKDVHAEARQEKSAQRQSVDMLAPAASVGSPSISRAEVMRERLTESSSSRQAREGIYFP